ncbi:RNA polymerase sigma-70 factor (ECF subfamily) [Filimonas zeae]|nr:sigma-70 family RNA polymerase sigma factor [Filimonas zeae]MDR6339587.1 RNA polymerase sigma-70 factor (ECF subfamily) [Filimonas zeae]
MADDASYKNHAVAGSAAKPERIPVHLMNYLAPEKRGGSWFCLISITFTSFKIQIKRAGRLSDSLMHNEKALFQRIAEGDEGAFETLFRCYVPQVRAAVAGVLGTEIYVKDILQEVFLNLWLNRDKLPAVENPRNWIFKITYNRCYTWLQKLQKEEARNHTAAIQLAGGDNGPEQLLHFRETRLLVQEAILQLTPRSREIYELHRNQGLKVPEIAQQLGVAPQTVSNSLHQSVLRIRQYLLEKGVVIPLAILFLLFF